MITVSVELPPEPMAGLLLLISHQISQSPEEVTVAIGAAVTAPLGIDQPTRIQVAFAAGYAPSTKAFKNALGALRTAGKVDYPGDGLIALTTEGRKLARVPDAKPVVDQLRRHVRDILDGEKQREIFEALCHLSHKAIGRNDLAGMIGYSPTTKAFKNNLGAMRSLGVIEYPGEGLVRIAEVLR